MSYLIATLLMLGSGISGWFIRNKVMQRQISHLRVRLEENESMHLNLQNELSLLRQESREIEDLRRDLVGAQEKERSIREALQKGRDENQHLKAKLAEAGKNREIILKQLADADSEKARTAQLVRLLEKEKESLRGKIAEMKDRITLLEHSPVRGDKPPQKMPGDMLPPVRTSQSTEKLKQKERPGKDVGSTGIRMLEKIAEELRDSKFPRG
ncbi:hypothetical protein JXA40_05535 [bacterium]|nr:hypothetical protein [candidate division CSSED10-310 bacterium]